MYSTGHYKNSCESLRIYPKCIPWTRCVLCLNINNVMSVSSGDDSVFTHACIIVQIALKSGLQQLMKGAYNSGEYDTIIVT